MPLTALEINFSTLPSWLSNAAQLLIGCALASRFERDFVSRAPGFLLAVSLTVILAMGMSALFALFLSWAMPAHPATTVLAPAPGGVAEMAITAKAPARPGCDGVSCRANGYARQHNRAALPVRRVVADAAGNRKDTR